MDCGICYSVLPPDAFYTLTCCKNNHACKDCIDLLLVPLCPFCRARLSLPAKRMAISLPSSGPTHEFWIDPMDVLYTDSRILRRQMRRLRKLQDRERDQLRNQQLAWINRVSKEKQRQALRRQIMEEQQQHANAAQQQQQHEHQRSDEEK